MFFPKEHNVAKKELKQNMKSSNKISKKKIFRGKKINWSHSNKMIPFHDNRNFGKLPQLSPRLVRYFSTYSMPEGNSISTTNPGELKEEKVKSKFAKTSTCKYWVGNVILQLLNARRQLLKNGRVSV